MAKLKFTLGGGPATHTVEDTATVVTNCGSKAASAIVVGEYLRQGAAFLEITAIE